MKRVVRSQRSCRAGLAVTGATLLVLASLVAGPAVGAEEPREPARGTFLVASRDLVDPNFRQTVVLLLEYGKEGAVGLVANRPSEVPLATLLPSVAALRGRPDTVYVGGPVEPLRMIFLFRSARGREDALAVFEDVWASSRFDLLESTAEEGRSTFRVFAGYAGWAPGQLDAEIERGDWFVLEAAAAAVFTPEPRELWQRLIQQTELRVVGL